MKGDCHLHSTMLSIKWHTGKIRNFMLRNLHSTMLSIKSGAGMGYGLAPIFTFHYVIY